MKPFDKEQVHDEQIVPLMSKIIEICKEHDIPMLCTFNYKHGEEGDPTKDFYSTSFMGSYQSPELRDAIDIIRNGGEDRPHVIAFTIFKSKEPDENSRNT